MKESITTKTLELKAVGEEQVKDLADAVANLAGNLEELVFKGKKAKKATDTIDKGIKNLSGDALQLSKSLNKVFGKEYTAKINFEKLDSSTTSLIEDEITKLTGSIEVAIKNNLTTKSGSSLLKRSILSHDEALEQTKFKFNKSKKIAEQKNLKFNDTEMSEAFINLAKYKDISNSARDKLLGFISNNDNTKPFNVKDIGKVFSLFSYYARAAEVFRIENEKLGEFKYSENPKVTPDSLTKVNKMKDNLTSSLASQLLMSNKVINEFFDSLQNENISLTDIKKNVDNFQNISGAMSSAISDYKVTKEKYNDHFTKKVLFLLKKHGGAYSKADVESQIFQLLQKDISKQSNIETLGALFGAYQALGGKKQKSSFKAGEFNLEEITQPYSDVIEIQNILYEYVKNGHVLTDETYRKLELSMSGSQKKELTEIITMHNQESIARKEKVEQDKFEQERIVAEQAEIEAAEKAARDASFANAKAQLAEEQKKKQKQTTEKAKTITTRKRKKANKTDKIEEKTDEIKQETVEAEQAAAEIEQKTAETKVENAEAEQKKITKKKNTKKKQYAAKKQEQLESDLDILLEETTETPKDKEANKIIANLKDIENNPNHDAGFNIDKTRQLLDVTQQRLELVNLLGEIPAKKILEENELNSFTSKQKLSSIVSDLSSIIDTYDNIMAYVASNNNELSLEDFGSKEFSNSIYDLSLRISKIRSQNISSKNGILYSGNKKLSKKNANNLVEDFQYINDLQNMIYQIYSVKIDELSDYQEVLSILGIENKPPTPASHPKSNIHIAKTSPKIKDPVKEILDNIKDLNDKSLTAPGIKEQEYLLDIVNQKINLSDLIGLGSAHKLLSENNLEGVSKYNKNTLPDRKKKIEDIISYYNSIIDKLSEEDKDRINKDENAQAYILKFISDILKFGITKDTVKMVDDQLIVDGYATNFFDSKKRITEIRGKIKSLIKQEDFFNEKYGFLIDAIPELRNILDITDGRKLKKNNKSSKNNADYMVDENGQLSFVKRSPTPSISTVKSGPKHSNNSMNDSFQQLSIYDFLDKQGKEINKSIKLHVAKTSPNIKGNSKIVNKIIDTTNNIIDDTVEATAEQYSTRISSPHFKSFKYNSKKKRFDSISFTPDITDDFSEDDNYGLTTDREFPISVQDADLLSERFINDGNTVVSVFQNANKEILTLTHNFQTIRDENGEVVARGWKTSLSIYDNYQDLEKQAIASAKNLIKLQSSLDAELSKSKPDQDAARIATLKQDINTATEKDRALHAIAKDFDRRDSSAYSYEQFKRNVASGVKEDEDKVRFTENINSEIEKVKKLKQAYVDLRALNAKFVSKDSTMKPEEFNESFNSIYETISRLEPEIKSFYETLYNEDGSLKANIKDSDAFNKYLNEYAKTFNEENNFKDALTTALRKTYEVKRNLENKLLKKSQENIPENEYLKLQKQVEASQIGYGIFQDQVQRLYGNDYQESVIEDIKNLTQFDRDTFSSNVFDTLTASIENYRKKVREAGAESDMFITNFDKLQKDIAEAQQSFIDGDNDAILNFGKNTFEFYARFETLKDFFSNGVGKTDLSFYSQISQLEKLSNSIGKVSSYHNKLYQFKNAYSALVEQLNNQEITEDVFNQKVENLIQDMKNFQKHANAYNKRTNKGVLIEGTEGKIFDEADTKKYLEEYAKQNGLVATGNEKVVKETGQVTMTFHDASGALVKLTGNVEEHTRALRILSTVTHKNAEQGKNFGKTLQSGIGSIFKGIGSDIIHFINNAQILYKVLTQMRQGLEIFRSYDAALTQISYTMNVSDQQLNGLGESAIQTAKDLSTSIENAMNIYQVYANMNTTPEEIAATARPTAILSNLSGVDSSTASDQVQGILQQFNMLKDGQVDVADASMHVVDVLDMISSNVAIDYAKGIQIISDAVQASGQVAYDAGMSYEQLASISAKVAERTREDGGSIGNAIKTIVTRISKVGKMPEYADQVSNEELSNASASLKSIGIDVYDPNGSFRELDVILGELHSKWDSLNDAQKANISYNIAATRQTSKFKNILEAWTDAADLARDATNADGNAEINQEKYEQSLNGRMQAVKTQMDSFWINLYSSSATEGILEFINNLAIGFNSLSDAIGPIPALLTATFATMSGKHLLLNGIGMLFSTGGIGSFAKSKFGSLAQLGAFNKAFKNFSVDNKSNYDDFKKVVSNFKNPNIAVKHLLAKNLSEEQIAKILTETFTDNVNKDNVMDIINAAKGSATASAAASGAGILSTLKNGALGLGAILKPFLLPLAGLAAAGVAVAGYKALDNKYVFTKDTADKHVDQSLDRYQQSKSTYSELEQQYNTNRDRIHELRVKANPTLSESAELTDLEKTNKLLSKELSLQEKISKVEQLKLAEDASVALGKNFNYQTRGRYNNVDANIMFYGTAIQAAEDEMKYIDELEQMKGEHENAIKSLEGKNDWISSFKRSSKQNLVDGINEEIATKESNLSQHINEIKEQTAFLVDDKGNVLDAKYQPIIDSANKLIDKYLLDVNEASATEDKLNNIFALAEFGDDKDALIASGKYGGSKSVLQKLSSLKDLKNTLLDKNVSQEDLVSYIMAIADPKAFRIEGIKENLKDDFKDYYDKLLSNKADDELEAFYNYYNDKNLNIADWDEDSILHNFEEAIKSSDNIIHSSTKFSSLFKSTLEQEKEQNIDSVTDQFQTDMKTIQETMDSMKTGNFKNSDITDLIQQFPELATETSDLQAGLEKLTLNKAKEALAGINEETKNVTDPKQLKAIKEYKQSLIDNMDLSRFNTNTLKDNIRENILGTGVDGLEKVRRNNAYFKDLMAMYGDDNIALQAILKLSLDPSMANATLEEWIPKVEDTVVQIEIEAKNNIIEDTELDLKDLNSQHNIISAKKEMHQSSIDRKNQLGDVIDKEDYQNLIDITENEISNLQNQLDRKQQAIIDLGPRDKLSNEQKETYDAYEADIIQASTTIENLRADQIGWNNAIEDIPLNKLKNSLSYLQNSASVIQATIDNKELLGEKVTELDYQKLIRNSDHQIANYKNQIEEVQNKLLKVKPGSDLYVQYREELNALKESLNSMKISQIEWNELIANLPITNIDNMASSVSNAINEMNSNTGVSVDTLKTLSTQFSDLNGVNIEDIFIRSANGIQVSTDKMKEFIEKQDEIASSKFQNEINAQQEAIKQYQNAIGDNTTTDKLKHMQDELDALLHRQAQYFAKSKELQEQFSNYQGIQFAKEQKNPGDEYTNVAEDLKTAKELYDKGLVGQPLFKAIAKYFSPNEFEDATNFIENYNRLSKYFTEDSSGPKAFLNALKNQGLATYEILADGSGTWVASFDDAQSAADQLGMSLETFQAIFGRLGDYDFDFTFISSMLDGQLQIEEATEKYANAQIKLAELKASGANEQVIADQQAVVDRYFNVLSNKETALNSFESSAGRKYVNSLVDAKDTINELNNMLLDPQNVNIADKLKKEIISIADEFEIDLTDNFTVDEIKFGQKLKEFGIGTIENPLSANEVLGAEAHNPVILDDYYSSLYKVTQAYNDGNSSAKEYINTLSQYTPEQLSQITLSDGIYNVDELHNAEDALENLVKTTGASKEQIINVLKAIGGVKCEPEISSEKVDEGTKEIKEKIADGTQSLQEMEESGDLQLSFSIKDSTNGLSVNELRSQIKELSKIQMQYSIDSPEWNAIQEMIHDRSIQISIQTQIDGGTSLEALSELTDEELAKTFNINVDDDGKLQEVRDTIELMKNSAALTVKIDQTQFDGLVAAGTSSEIDIIGNNEDVKNKVDEAVEYTEKQNPVINIDGNGRPAISKAQSAVRLISGMSPVLNINAKTYEITNAINRALSGDFRINVFANVIGPHTGGNGIATGTMTSIARSSGTAYNVLNMKPITGAYAKGNVALESDETALVNEEIINGHSESIVRDGKWSLIPGGAHFENLKKGDLIFSARQTESLLKHGQIPGHARAYASGTLQTGINAYARPSGNLNGNFQGGAAGNSGGNSTNSNHDNAIKDNTDKLQENTESQDKVSEALQKTIDKLGRYKDWSEVALDRLQREVDRHMANADNAGAGIERTNHLNRAYEAIQKEIVAQKKAKLEYEKHADKVAKEVGLSKTLKQQVENGTIKIELLSADQQEQVKAYEEWYSKILDSVDAIRDLEQQRKEIDAAKAENVLGTYDIMIGKRKGHQDYWAAKQELRKNQYQNMDKGSVYYKQMEKQLYYSEEQAKLKEKEITQYTKETKNYFKNRYNEFRKQGLSKAEATKRAQNDKTYQQMLITTRGLKTEFVELTNASIELKDAMFEAEVMSKKWRVDVWNRAESKHDAVIAYKESTNNINHQISEKDYEEGIKIDEKQIQKKYAERELLAKKWREVTDNGSRWNEKSQELEEAIAKLDAEILSDAAQIQAKVDRIMELRMKPYYDAQEKLAKVIEEYQSLQKMLGDTESFFNDDGSFTTNGLTNIALIQESVDATKQTIANATKQLDILEQNFKNGNLSPEEFKTKSNEILDVIRKNSEALVEYKQQMLNMYETQIKMENDLLQKNIDKRIAALDAKQKYYEYDKTLKKKSKDIDALKSQIAALEGTSNSAAKARLEKLKAELAEAEQDMDDTVYQHEQEMKKTGFQDLQSDAEKALENTLNALKKNTDFQQAVINQMLENVKTEYDGVYTHLNEVITQHGVVVTETFKEMLGAAADFNAEVGKFPVPDKGVLGQNTDHIYTGNDKTQGVINGTLDKNDTAGESAHVNGSEDIERDKIKKQLQQWLDSLRKPTKEEKNDKKISDLAKYMIDKHDKIANRYQFKKLADILGIDAPSGKEWSKWTPALKTKILNKFKSYGFANGGTVRKAINPDYMADMLRGAVRSTGDSGFIGINPGETILTAVQTEKLVTDVSKMQELVDKSFNIKNSRLIPNYNVVNNNDYSNTITFNIEKVSSEVDVKHIAEVVQKQMGRNTRTELKKLR